MRLQLFTYSLERRFIWLQLYRDRPIDEGIAEQFLAMLNRLQRASVGPITFYLSGKGGDSYACIKMAHAIMAASNPIVVVPFFRVRSGCFMLTQAGTACYPMPNTKFTFHLATDYFIGKNLKDRKMSQKDYEERIRQLRLIDATQALFFTRRGRPIRRIFELFAREATLTMRDAKRLKLIQGTYSRVDFLQDRKVAHHLAGRRR